MSRLGAAPAWIENIPYSQGAASTSQVAQAPYSAVLTSIRSVRHIILGNKEEKVSIESAPKASIDDLLAVLSNRYYLVVATVSQTQSRSTPCRNEPSTRGGGGETSAGVLANVVLDFRSPAS